MNFIKGHRFNLPIIQRIGIIEDREARRVTWNRHIGCELHFVLKGTCAWEIEGRAGTLVVSGGNFVVIPSGVRHRAVGESIMPSVRLGVICEKPSPKLIAGSSFTAADLKHLFGEMTRGALNVRPIPASLANALREVRAAVLAYAPDEGISALRLRVLGEYLLVETAKVLSSGEAIRHTDELIPQICKWIQAHLGEKITNDQLVHLSGYGRSQFFRLFYEQMGTTPNEYVIRQRIEKAKGLLSGVTEHDLSIKSISRKCGFNSASFFAATFRRITGQLPTDFIQEK